MTYHPPRKKKSGVWEPLPEVKKTKKSRRKKERKERKNPEPNELTLRRVAKLSAIPYKEYLRSNWWRKRRARSLRLANYTCQDCGKKEKLQVHHKHYKSKGMEKDDDLEVLCEDCHKGRHEPVWRELREHLRSRREGPAVGPGGVFLDSSEMTALRLP